MSGVGGDSIDGRAWSIYQVFSGRRYGLDTYQREFAWETKHVAELLTDLSERFLSHWRPEHDSPRAATYPPYFLGPIVTHHQQPLTLIVDGQQRLTVLMLLFIWLQRLQAERDDAVSGLESLILLDFFGESRFAVEGGDDNDERRECLTALMKGTEIDESQDLSRSTRAMASRYNDIDELFPETLRGDALPCFIYWLLDRVYLVEISTSNPAIALETFETMNDRGLRLGGLDLLKSFVLAQVQPAEQVPVNLTWRARMSALTDVDSNANVSFVKNWLRAKYSRSAADDSAVSHSFDKWVRHEHRNLGIRFPGEFRTFVDHMDKLSRRYVELLTASKAPQPSLDAVYANALNSVTLQLPLILAAVAPDDDTATFVRKAAMVAGFLDIVVARRMVNWRDYGYDALANSVFSLAREIRNLDADTLAKRLGDEVAALPETFDAVAAYGLRPRNRTRVRYLLARMTAWLEVQSIGLTTAPAYAAKLHELMAYEIEHIWADKPELQPHVQLRKFSQIRSSFGALVLLPKSFNAAYGARPYAEKIDQYFGQANNTLAKSLHPHCYELHPGFRRAIDHYDLPFQPYTATFDEHAIAQRQALYQRLCELVWDPAQYGLIVPTAAARRQTPERTRAHFGVSVALLVERGFIPVEARLIGSFREVEHHAHVTIGGHIRIESGEVFESPSPAAGAVLNRGSWNGWTFWRVIMPDGSTPTLSAIRANALKAGIAVGDY